VLSAPTLSRGACAGRVQECQQAARALTEAVGDKGGERGSRAPLLRDTTPEEYQTHKAALSAPHQTATHPITIPTLSFCPFHPQFLAVLRVFENARPTFCNVFMQIVLALRLIYLVCVPNCANKVFVFYLPKQITK
jgi:galactokinase